MAKYCEHYLILRCSAMIGNYLAKGVLKDILDGRPLFVTATSKMQFVDAYEVGAIIDRLTKVNNSNQVYNVGGISNLEVTVAMEMLGRPADIQKGAQFQFYEMSVAKLAEKYPLKTSLDYVKDFAKLVK